MAIPNELEGWEFTPDHRALQAGVASASLDVPGAIERREFVARSDDDNARRHAGVLAMFLWLGGWDQQWLYVEGIDNRLWSHDHGHYLPGGHDWNATTLMTHVLEVSNDGALGRHAGMNKDELLRLADALDALEPRNIVEAACAVPGSWAIPHADIAALCSYADIRRTMAAKRLREVNFAL